METRLSQSVHDALRRRHVTNIAILNPTDVTLEFAYYLTSNKMNTSKKKAHFEFKISSKQDVFLSFSMESEMLLKKNLVFQEELLY